MPIVIKTKAAEKSKADSNPTFFPNEMSEMNESGPTDHVEPTEDGLAEQFAAKHAGEFRFDHRQKQWFWWDGNTWRFDETQRAVHLCRLLARKYRGDETKMASTRAAEGIERMARCDPRLAVTSDVWDRDPFLLGTPSGTVDLRTGKLREPRRQDFITKTTSVAPAPKGTPAAVFEKFLDDATNGDKDLQRFLQQFAGYCLTGLTSEHAILFIFGPGGNGKSVLQNILFQAMGSYAAAVSMDTFAATKQQAHSTNIAMLQSVRLVIASENERDHGWPEARMNQLTGGDPVTARLMRKDNVTFIPKLKLMLAGNHKPRLPGVNKAVQRRLILVPFLNTPQHPDQTLPNKLQQELPAVLRWMIDGCLDWQANGLTRPTVVREATQEYFEEQDLCGRWIAEQCDCGPDKKATATELYGSWSTFAAANGEATGSMKLFGDMLAGRGFQKKKSGSIVYLGIQLAEQST